MENQMAMPPVLGQNLRSKLSEIAVCAVGECGLCGLKGRASKIKKDKALGRLCTSDGPAQPRSFETSFEERLGKGERCKKQVE
jgi:hypothetical protein